MAVLKQFGLHPAAGVRITLISNTPVTPYSGMLPGCIAGHYDRAQAGIDLRPLCRFARAEFVHATVTGLDLARREVLLAARPPARFDLLALNIGSTPALAGIPGADRHALPIKPVAAFLNAWDALQASWKCRPPDPRVRIAVVGGGAGSVELLLAVRQRLLAGAGGALPLAQAQFEFHLVTAAATLLAGHNRSVQRRFERLLRERAVRISSRRRVVEVRDHLLLCDAGDPIPFDLLLWATHAAAPAWPKAAGLATDPDGFVAVNEFLQSTSHPEVFAAGDIAALIGEPRPKSGVFAVREGLPLAGNLRRALEQRPLRAFRPQRQFLSLISAGDRYAVASRGPFACEGRWVWHWKDWIDRRWMRGYQHPG